MNNSKTTTKPWSQVQYQLKGRTHMGFRTHVKRGCKMFHIHKLIYRAYIPHWWTCRRCLIGRVLATTWRQGSGCRWRSRRTARWRPLSPHVVSRSPWTEGCSRIWFSSLRERKVPVSGNHRTCTCHLGLILENSKWTCHQIL